MLADNVFRGVDHEAATKGVRNQNGAIFTDCALAKTNACAKASTFAGVFPVQVLNRRCLAVDADDVIDAVLVRNRKELIGGFFNREIINHFTVFINDDVFGLIRCKKKLA